MMDELGLIIEPDLVFDTDNDLMVANSHDQNIMHILLAEKGNFYGSPLVGMGIGKYQNATLTDPRAFVTNATKELENDGLSNVTITGGQTSLTLNADKVKEFKTQAI